MTKPVTRDPLIKKLEKAVTDVLDNADASVGDKLRAIDAGAKVLQIKHKISGGGEDGGNYFGS